MNYQLNSSIIFPNRPVKPPLFYTPEPGYYDGPELSFTDDLSGIDDFRPKNYQETPRSTEQLELIPSYLDNYAGDGGVNLGEDQPDFWDRLKDKEDQRDRQAVHDEDLCHEISRSNHCGYSAIVLKGEKTDRIGFHKLHCKKLWCPVCGGKNGLVHQSRKQNIYEKIDLKKENLRQLIFTLPDQARQDFMNRAKVNAFIRLAERIAKESYPEKKCVAYFHPFGDPLADLPDNDLEYHPHVNVHVFEEKNLPLKVSKDHLESMRKRFKNGLRGLGVSVQGEVDIHYAFATTPEKIGHKIKYMTRPTWGERHLKFCSEEIKRFLVIEMKGFTYLRFFGALAHCKHNDEEEISKSEYRTIEEVTGEKWRFVGYDYNVNFDQKAKEGDFEEISPGFFIMKKRG